MRIILIIAFLIIATDTYSQEWRDSLNYARTSYKKGEYEKALRYYESAQKKAPDGVDLSDEMAQSAYKAREFEKAEKIYQQSASTKKDKTAKARSYHNLGNSRMKKKDYQGAIESYKESLRNDPKNEKTRYNLSEAIRRLKEEQKKQQEQQKDQNKDQKDQQNKDQQDQKNEGKNQNKDQNKGQDQKNGKDQQQNGQQGNKKGNNNQQGNRSGKSGGLPNKSVERMLDELMKAEAATKRKIGGNQNGSSSTKSGKDW